MLLFDGLFDGYMFVAVASIKFIQARLQRHVPILFVDRNGRGIEKER